MSELRYNVLYRKKQHKAAMGRAYCGLNSIGGGFEKPVMLTVFGIRPKGVLS